VDKNRCVIRLNPNLRLFLRKLGNSNNFVCEAMSVLVGYAAYCDRPFWQQKEFGQGQFQNNKRLLMTMPTFSAFTARECYWFSRRKDAAHFENLLSIGVHPANGHS
jgi:hypothetical protein